MAIASLYNFKARPLLGPIEVNLSTREVHSLTATMPSFAVERGADLTDHRKIAPNNLTIEGWISSAAIRSDMRLNEDGEVIRQASNNEGAQGLSVKEAYAQIEEVFKGKEPFDVVTNLRNYTNMHFTSFVITRDAETSEIIAFAASMVEIQFAESQSTTVRVVRSKKVDAPKTAPKKKVGKKETKPTNVTTARGAINKLAPEFVRNPAGRLNALLGGG